MRPPFRAQGGRERKEIGGTKRRRGTRVAITHSGAIGTARHLSVKKRRNKRSRALKAHEKEEKMKKGGKERKASRKTTGETPRPVRG